MKPAAGGTNRGVLINLRWLQLFTRSSTLLYPHPTSLFSGFRLWEGKKFELWAISCQISKSCKHTASASLASVEISTGLPVHSSSC